MTDKQAICTLQASQDKILELALDDGCVILTLIRIHVIELTFKVLVFNTKRSNAA